MISEVVSRSRSARHKKSPKPTLDSGGNHTKSRVNKSSETRSGTVKNFDYEAHLSKNFDATSHFPKTTTAAELSGGAPDSNSRQDRFLFLPMNIHIHDS